MNNFTPRGNDDTIHIIGQTINIFYCNFIISISCDRTMMNRTFNMLPSYPYIHDPNINSRLFACFVNGFLNCVDSFVNIGYNATNYSIRNSFTHSKDFELSVFIFAPHNCANFGCSNIQTDDDFIFLHVRFIYSD